MAYKKKSVKVGLVGCGGMGSGHARCIHSDVPSAELVAVADIIPERAEKLAEKLGCKAYGSIEEMLKGSPEIDLVDICSPSGLHADQGLIAAKAGKHVIVEKPFDRSVAKAKKLIALCDRKGLKLGCIFQCRLTPDCMKVKKAIDDGKLGRIVTGTADTMWYRAQSYYDSDAWRGTIVLDGGCLWNQGVHMVDMLIWMLGDPKKVLFAELQTQERKMESEDIGLAAVQFKSGALGVIRATTLAYPGLATRVEICGTKGCAVLQDNRLVSLDYQGMKEETEKAKAAGKGGASDAMAISLTGHVGQLEDMAQAIMKNKEPFVSGKDALRAVKLLTEVYEVGGMPKLP